MIFGDPRVPFSRPVQSTPGFTPRSFDTGFIPEFEPYPQVMLPQFARLPAGVHQPLAAEPGGSPAAVQDPAAAAVAAQATAQPPSATAIKKRAMRMLPPGLVMALGIMPPPRAGNVRSGLNPDSLVAKGRNPGV